MPLSEVVKVAREIFECTFDTWIICESENSCVELHHEGTICFASAGLNLSAGFFLFGKARENGEAYARLTAQRAAAAVDRRQRGERCRDG